MLVVVPHANGAQARAIAARLEAGGHQVRRLSRQAGEGVVKVDPDSEDDLARAFEDADGLAFTVPQDYRPGAREAYAGRVVRAAARAGVDRIVLNMGGPVHEQLDRPVAEDLRRIRRVFQNGPVPLVVLQPTTFLDNLSEPWAAAPIVNDGVLAYPVPTDARVSWISHDSLGDFVRAALERPVAGRIFDVGGPEAVDGADVARALEAAIGRPVRYQPIALDEFAASLNAMFGPPAGDDIADLYRHLETCPDATARDPASWAELGVTPETVEAWAGRQRWRA